MIKINCNVDYMVPYTQLLPFQGNLKTSSPQEITKLAESLLNDGLVTPFIVWHKPSVESLYGDDLRAYHDKQPHYIIDGHRRLLALQLIAQDNPDVLNHSYPVMIVTAGDLETAKAMLLQICSTYGRITPKGLQAFIDNTSIKIDTFGLKVKLPKMKLDTPKVGDELDAYKKIGDDHVIMKIKVAKEDVRTVTDLLVKANIEVFYG